MIKKVPIFFREKGYIVKRFFKIKLKKKKKLRGIETEIGPRYFSKGNGTLKTSSTYAKIKVHAEPGAPIKFTFTPRSYLMSLSKDYVETLDMPQEIVDSESAWMAYRNICNRIYNHEQAMGLVVNSWEQETDIYLWIKPYEEPVVERDINGVLQRRIRKATKRPSRLRRRTLFVLWMIENSDWQEQLVLHYWNLPRKGHHGEVLLPWFTLEVEYRKGARKILCNNHHADFCAVESAEGTYGCSVGINEDLVDGGLEIGLALVVEAAPALGFALTEDGSSASASTSTEDSLNTSPEPTTPSSEESLSDSNTILLGDGLMAGSGKASVKSVKIRPASRVSTAPRIVGEIEEQQSLV